MNKDTIYNPEEASKQAENRQKSGRNSDVFSVCFETRKIQRREQAGNRQKAGRNSDVVFLENQQFLFNRLLLQFRRSSPRFC